MLTLNAPWCPLLIGCYLTPPSKMSDNVEIGIYCAVLLVCASTAILFPVIAVAVGYSAITIKLVSLQLKVIKIHKKPK